MDPKQKEFHKWEQVLAANAAQYLVYNVSHDKNKKILTYNISVNNECFRRQLVPFYSALALDLYEYYLIDQSLIPYTSHTRSKSRYRDFLVNSHLSL